MHRFIHRHILLPAFESGLKRRKTFRYWNDLERTQWLSRPAIESIQFDALRRLIVHAYEHCPYYRDTWDRLHLHPHHLNAPADITRWPVIDRDTIREHRLAMRSAHRGLKLISKATGGSSGVPLQFDLDLDSHDRRTAAWHRGYAWAHAAPGTRQLYLWGGVIGHQTGRARLKHDLHRRLYRQRLISCFDHRGDLALRFAAELDAYRPDVIVAYTNPLHEVARSLEEAGPVPSFRPRSIVVGAEKLHPFQRERIERVFRAPVFETYGSREFMLIGAECERHDGLHLTGEHLLVEVLDDDGRPTPPGTEGNVVITDLYNRGMPFIRYFNGDRAIAGFSECPCGRGLPLMKQVIGRRLDLLIGTNGKTVPGEFFPHLVKDFPAVRRFQIVQEALNHVRFRMTADGITGPDRNELELRVRTALGPAVHVEFEPVSQIALTAAGKLQVVVNRVATRKAG